MVYYQPQQGFFRLLTILMRIRIMSLAARLAQFAKLLAAETYRTGEPVNYDLSVCHSYRCSARVLLVPFTPDIRPRMMAHQNLLERRLGLSSEL